MQVGVWRTTGPTKKHLWFPSPVIKPHRTLKERTLLQRILNPDCRFAFLFYQGKSQQTSFRKTKFMDVVCRKMST